jgi:hypothetical protein
MSQLGRLAVERPGLGWLKRDTAGCWGPFVAHAVPQQDAVAEGHPAPFVLSPRQGETMITTWQTLSQAADGGRHDPDRRRDPVGDPGARPRELLGEPGWPFFLTGTVT